MLNARVGRPTGQDLKNFNRVGQDRVWKISIGVGQIGLQYGWKSESGQNGLNV